MTLDPQIPKLIEQRVTSGRYKSAEDVVAAALASLGQQERLTELAPVDLEKLYPGVKQALQAGLVQARAGRIVDGEQFFEALESGRRRRSGRRRPKDRVSNHGALRPDGARRG